MWSASILVTTASTGVRYRNEASDSSASATMNSPLPRRALAPAASSRPPMTKVGIHARFGQDAGDQRGGGGLAVRAGHRDALLEAHQFRQHHGARHHRDMCFLAPPSTSGLSSLHRGGHHHDIGPLDMRCRMTLENLRTLLGQAPRGGVIGHIGTADLKAQVDQHFGDAAHAGAADADKMDVFDFMFHRASSMHTCATVSVASGLARARALRHDQQLFAIQAAQ